MKTRWQGKGLYDVFYQGVDEQGNIRYTYQWTRRYEKRSEFMATHIYVKTKKYVTGV
jgi:hypothetical protein